MGSNVLFLHTNPSVVLPDPNPLVAANQLRQHQGADSHGTIMLGNIKAGKAISKVVPFSIIHGAKAPIYNLALSRPETLAPWLDSCDVNFLGTPLPMPYPAGVTKFGIPALPAGPTIEMPTIGMPSIPFPSLTLPWLDSLIALYELIASFVTFNLPVPPQLQLLLSSILQTMVTQVKLAVPALSATVPIEWYVNLIAKINPLQLPGLFGNMIQIPPLAWPWVLNLSLPQLTGGSLPDIPEVEMSPEQKAALQAILDTLVGAFTTVTGAIDKGFGILLAWFAGLGELVGTLATAMLATLSINVSFPFPGIDLGQVPPAGTPWPTPFFPIGVVPLVSWPAWMRAPVVANVPLALPPGTNMPIAGPGTFAYTSLPGYLYQTFFVINVKAGVAPGVYTQEFFLEGSSSPTGLPVSKIGKIVIVAQVLENNLTPGIRPAGLLSYGGPGAAPAGFDATPLMDRAEQYDAAPQQEFRTERTFTSTYEEAVGYVALNEVASDLTAVQASYYETTDVIREESGSEDTVLVPGNGIVYMVRLAESEPDSGIWLEEALIPASAYTAELDEDVYDDETKRIQHRLKITWPEPVQANPEEPEEVNAWAFPLGTPAPHIPKGELPVAVAPSDPAGPAVTTSGRYRLYTAGIIQVEGAVLIPGGTGVDLTNATPEPLDGPVIIHFMVADGRLLDKEVTP